MVTDKDVMDGASVNIDGTRVQFKVRIQEE